MPSLPPDETSDPGTPSPAPPSQPGAPGPEPSQPAGSPPEPSAPAGSRPAPAQPQEWRQQQPLPQQPPQQPVGWQWPQPEAPPQPPPQQQPAPQQAPPWQHAPEQPVWAGSGSAAAVPPGSAAMPGGQPAPRTAGQMASPPANQPAPPAGLPQASLAPQSPGQRLADLVGLGADRQHWIVVALRIAMLALIPIGGVVIVFMLALSSGFRFGLLTATAAIALLPVPFLVFWFGWLDRFDPARWEYLAFAFGWGACVSTSLSLGANTLGSYVFERQGLPGWGVAVWVAPVSEEITKGLAPLLLLWLWRREVIGIADAVMYAGLSAAGFAMTENILYLGGVYVSGEQLQGAFGAVLGVVSLIVVRLGLTGFLHPLFTAMTGVGVGMAARTSNLALKWAYPLVGLVLAMLMHGTWNFTATLAQRDPRFLGYLYFLVALPLLFGFVVFGLWIRTAPGRTVREVLPDYVRAGWLSPPEVGSLLTLRRRLWARRWAKQVAGQDGARAMRAYQIACTRLALLREARSRGVRDWEPGDPERRLLDALTAYRQFFTGRDRTVPEAWWDGSRYLVTYPNGERRQVEPPRSYAMPVPSAPRFPWDLPPRYAPPPRPYYR